MAPAAHMARGCRSRRGSLRRGFTLAEMLAVLAILGVLGFMALVKMGRESRGHASTGMTREIYARLMQARFGAVSGGTRVQVTLSPGTAATTVLLMQSATLPGMSPPPVPAPGSEYGPVADQVQRRGAAQVVAVSGANDPGGAVPTPGAAPVAVVFYPDGTADVPALGAAARRGGATVYIADDLLGNPHRVTVMGRTGFVRVVDQ